MKININADAAVVFANKLEKINKSALPAAIRNTLNAAAFDVKKNTMPAAAKGAFIQRKPTFFKANSKVRPASGSSVRSMQAIVGFTPLSGKGNTVEDLQEQEYGGSIGGRAFIPLKKARAGGSWNKNVRSKMRIGTIKTKIVDMGNAGPKNAKNPRQKFIKSAVHAGKGGFILGDRKTGRGNRILWGVNSLRRKNGNIVVKATPLFAVKAKRKVKVRGTGFMKGASIKSGSIMEAEFAKHAERQIAKYK
jgi:hypothetical protein